MYALDYHEAFTNAIMRKIPIKDIQDVTDSPAYADIKYSFNPSTLEKFLSSEIAKQVLKSGKLDDSLRRINTMLILIIIGTGATLVMVFQMSGGLKSLGV